MFFTLYKILNISCQLELNTELKLQVIGIFINIFAESGISSVVKASKRLKCKDDFVKTLSKNN